MKRALALSLVLLLLLPPALADGMMFISDRDMWNLQPEENQLAAIHYEYGTENLLLTVSPGSNFTGDRAVWIVPVPAKPEDVKIDVLKGFPKMYGGNFEDKYSSAVSASAAAQVIYATFPVSVLGGAPAIFLSAYTFGMAGSIRKSSDVEIHERVEKMGVTTEVVTATDAYALRNHLVSLGMDGSGNDQELLQEYIGKDYSFVVSSISNVTAFREAGGENGEYDPYSGAVHANQIGVFVRFPTNKIYYPLRPTAVYGSRQVPVLLYVTRFVAPELYDGIRTGSEVTYFTDEYFRVSDDLAPFFNKKTMIAPLEYTKIKITVPADRFTEDLWIDPEPPADIRFKQMYLEDYPWISVVVYIIFSMLSSLIAGMLAFRKKTVEKKTLLLHGLWNCGTFLLFAHATKEYFPQEEYGKRVPYILAFYFTFAVLVSTCAVVLSPSLIPGVLIGWVFGLLSPLLSLLLLVIPLMMFGSMYNPDPGAILMIVFFSIVAIGFALLPVPMLIWLKRWIDPAPVPVAVQVPGTDEGVPPAP